MAIPRPALALLLAALSLHAQPPAKTPAFAILDAADSAQFETWAKSAGWQVILATAPSTAAIDVRVQSLAAAVQDAIRNHAADPARIYLAGRGASSAAVFYAVSRLPDLFSAAFAVGPSPQPAIDTGIVFTANFTNTPIFWAGTGQNDPALAAKWKAAGLNLEFHYATGLTMGAVFQWLAAHTRQDFPAEIDCETSSIAFNGCYWVQMVRFDAREKNDVLPTSALPAGSVAWLDLGGFAYKPGDPGPGVPVTLPPKYDGPLKAGDRILELDGKPIENAEAFDNAMRAMTEQRDAVVLVARGAERRRIETRILLPQRSHTVTARVQAQYLAGESEIRAVSRAVAELQVTIPAFWVPVTLYWNGLPLGEIKTPGCQSLTVRNELLHSEPCQARQTSEPVRADEPPAERPR